MAWTLAESLRACIDQVNRRHPNRSKVSDGTIGDPAHRLRVSDHNPCSDHGIVHALDLTHDPEHGFDAHAWVRWLAAVGDHRVKYLISSGQIWNPTATAWNTYRRLRAEGHSAFEASRMALPGWRTYTGSNPHDRHAHVSIQHSDLARSDTGAWFPTTTPDEVRRMFPDHQFVFITGDTTAFYSWDPATSAVYAWNGAPGPIPNAAGQKALQEAGGIRALKHMPLDGLVAVVGNPGENAQWPVWRFRDLRPEHRQ